MNARTPPDTRAGPATPGIWLLATHLLGRPAPMSEPYPHICGLTCSCHPMRYRVPRKNCPSCVDAANTTTGTTT